METTTWTSKPTKILTWTSITMKRSIYASKTIGRSKSTYNCQEIDRENWEDRRSLFEQCRDYYDIAGRARRYTCLLHYCENYKLLCTPRYTEISSLCTFWYINFRVYELFGYVNFGYMHFRVYALLVLCYPTFISCNYSIFIEYVIVFLFFWQILLEFMIDFYSINKSTWNFNCNHK